MGAKTGIEWTDATWNPILGCSRVSEGCRNCYAEGIAGRFGQGKQTVYSGLTHIVNGRPVWTGQIVETRQLLEPLSWRKPKRIFVNSMSDLFHENVSDELRDKIFAVMALCPQHTFQVLTKRPERMLAYMTEYPDRRSHKCWRWHVADAIVAMQPPKTAATVAAFGRVLDEPALLNVWLGVSVENQAAADERIPLLLRTPAAKRFISAEPLLGLVDLRPWLGLRCDHEGSYSEDDTGATICRECEESAFLDWVICGGESGPHARMMHPDWARALRDQCAAAGVPFFFKQWGEWAPTEDPAIAKARGIPLIDCMSYVGKKVAGSLLDGVEHKAFPGVADE